MDAAPFIYLSFYGGFFFFAFDRFCLVDLNSCCVVSFSSSALSVQKDVEGRGKVTLHGLLNRPPFSDSIQLPVVSTAAAARLVSEGRSTEIASVTD